MASEVSTAGPKAYGGLKPSCTVGAEDFAAHDATQAWGDDGAAAALTASMASGVHAYGAEQVKQGVLDYVTNAYMDGVLISGAPVAMVDVSNAVVPFGVGWKLEDFQMKIIAEAEGAGDEAMLAAMRGMVERLYARFHPASASTARLAPPSRPIIKGGSKPSGAVRAVAHRATRIDPAGKAS